MFIRSNKYLYCIAE